VTRGSQDNGDSGAADYDAARGDFWLKQQLGFSVQTAPGRAVAAIDCDERHLNPHGTVHGAVIFALVDTGMGAATMTVLDESSMCATIEIHTRFLAPVFSGPLRAEVAVIKAGRRIVHLEAVVTNEHGDDVARASGSFAVIPAPSANWS
jgi:acyl-CoA thioesterase